MREILALLFVVCIFVVTIYLAAAKSLDYKLVASILTACIIGGFAIAYGNFIKKLKWGQVEIETAKKEIGEIKESAIDDIKNEIKIQKVSLSSLIDTAKELQNKIEEQKRKVEKLNDSAEKTKSDIEKLSQASKKIALIQIKTTYLVLETKNEFGTPRAVAAIEEVNRDLNRVLEEVIPDPVARSAWVSDLQDKLPPRK